MVLTRSILLFTYLMYFHKALRQRQTEKIDWLRSLTFPYQTRFPLRYPILVQLQNGIIHNQMSISTKCSEKALGFLMFSLLNHISQSVTQKHPPPVLPFASISHQSNYSIYLAAFSYIYMSVQMTFEFSYKKGEEAAHNPRLFLFEYRYRSYQTRKVDNESSRWEGRRC